MLRGRALGRAALVLAAALWTSPAGADNAPGAGCTSGADSAGITLGGNNLYCNGSTWQFPAYQLGATATGCNSGSAGMMQWTGSVVSPNNTLEYCNGSIWGTFGGGGSSALSALTAGTVPNTIDSTNNAQTWKWGTLSTQTAMTLTTSSMTTGALLSLQDTAIAGTSTGQVLSILNTTTGPGYGVYSAMTGTANTGYAGYFSNTGTNAINYGLYASTSSSTGYAGYFQGPVNITSSAQVGSTLASCTSGNGGALQYTTSGVLEVCNGSSWAVLSNGSTYDLSMFYPGAVSGGAIVRVTSVRTATYPTNLTGSYCVAKEGATASTTITLNQVHAGSSSSVGTVVFASGGGTNVTNCTFTAASGISLVAGDALEFAFPATPDTTLGDVAITIEGTHN